MRRRLHRGYAEIRDLVRIATCAELAPGGRWTLAAAKLRHRAGGLRRDAVVNCRVAALRFGRESFAHDWYVFEEIFLERIYEGLPFARACVLDLGAHKGYFGAYALIHGAERVVSFEPEEANFRRLAATAEAVRTWTARREAVAGEGGQRTLSIRDSWSHTLVDCADDRAQVTVSAVGLADVLRDHAGERQLVKLDIEGAEYEALARAPTELLERVDALVVEAHPGTSGRPAEIVAVAGAAALRGAAVELEHPAPLLRFTRERDRPLVH